MDKWFVFSKDLGFPVYIRCNSDEFLPGFISTLNSMQFTELPEEGVDEAKRRVGQDENARVLEIRLANSAIAQQIRSTVPNDAYGLESIVPRDGYRVYRYKGSAIVLYSFGVSEWVAGCFADIGSDENKTACRCILNRYLSWALAPMGVVGFWGRKNRDGIEVLRQRESLAEAIFIDIRNGRLVTSGGVEAIRSDCRIVRYDTMASTSQVRMDKIQLVSFLVQYTSYLDYAGLSIPLRQAVQEIAQRIEGIVYAEGSTSKSSPRLSL